MKDIKGCLATNYRQLWLHWRQQQISRVPGVGHWRWSEWLYSVCDKTEITAVQQSSSMLVLEAPSCQINRKWPYQYKYYSTPFPVNRSQCSHRHILSHLQYFPLQETGTVTFSSSYAKLFFFKLEFFPSSISLARAAFSWSIFGTTFSWPPQAQTQTLLLDYLRLTCFVQTHRPRTEWRTSHKAKLHFFKQPSARLARNAFMKLHKPSFACHNLPCKPPWNALVHVTTGHFQMIHLQANSGQTELG